MDRNQAGPEHVEEGTEHLGAVEGDRPTDVQQGNRNADGVNDQGLPDDAIAQCEDVLGANADETQG
ncbi:MAG: hypothetical protein LC804_04185 [Acidobacteria bacterium]|nr:hypothetical protein [Acidobacteriota bacterium]